jgi:replicative DNA helicase
VHTGAAAHHAALVKEKSVLRKLIKIANSVTEKCYRADVEQNSKNLIADVQGQLLELSSFDEISRVKSFASLMPMVFEEISASNAGDSSVDVCVPTGYYDIDDTTGGLPLGALSVIGGRGGIGKSTMALDIAIFNAKRGANVVYFALEMSASQMCKKAIARLVAPEVPATLLFKRNGLEGVHWDSVAQGISQAQELSIWVQDASIRKPSQIRSDMQEVVVKSGRPIDLCIIDYAQLVEPERHQSNRVIEVDSILKQLRSIAKDFGCAVLALSQLSRGLEARSDKRPTKADFRESGGFEQEAALMLGIYRDDYYNPNTEEKNIVELSILKSRFSGDGIVKLLFDRDYGVFKNLKY